LKQRYLPKVLSSGSRVAGIFVSTILVLGVIFLLLPRTILLVKEGTEGHERAAIAVGEGSLVEVAYVHSMYGVRQNEIFAIRRGSVFNLEKVEFGSLAAALYYDPDPPSGVVFQDSVWVIKGEGKIYPVLKYRVSAGTGHTLKVSGQVIDLSGWPGLLQVELESRSRLSSLFIALRAGLFNALGS
jgi:hypothetical protein